MSSGTHGAARAKRTPPLRKLRRRVVEPRPVGPYIVGHLLLLSAWLLPPPVLASFARDDVSRFQGTWDLVSLESNGAVFDPATRGTLIVRGEQAKIIVEMADQKVENAYRLTLYPLRIPAEFDVLWEDGRITRGIYRFAGDELIRCHGQPDGVRPTAFDAGPGTGHVLSIWRRPPPKPPGEEDHASNNE